MAKKITGYVKLQVPAGAANPSPPIGPALGQRGLNIMEFCKAFNAKTQQMEKGMPIPVIITAYQDRSFTFEMKQPPVSYFLKRAANLKLGKKPASGSKTPGKGAPAGKVTEALAALRRSGDIVAKGVLLNTDDGGGPNFDYTKLNEIKPALIAEATSNARKSAEQFAKDSGARIGGIRNANQGVISIENRDAGSPQIKKIRVVTTVEYFLKD